MIFQVLFYYGVLFPNSISKNSAGRREKREERVNRKSSEKRTRERMIAEKGEEEERWRKRAKEKQKPSAERN